MADEPDPAVVRAVLREHGIDVPARGRISAEHEKAYAELVNQPEAGEYDAGVTEADFGPDPGTEGDTPEIPPAEIKPRRLRSAPRLPALRRPKAQGKAKPKRKHARVPVDRLIERAWEALGRLAAPISPAVSNVLQLQSPVAGLIMEDIVRDTMVDRALQPIARAEEKAEKVIALAGPPMIVGALQAAEGLPPEQKAIRQAILVPMLRECLVVWVKVAGDKIEEKARRDEEMGPVNEQVDRLLAAIFTMPEPVAADAA